MINDTKGVSIKKYLGLSLTAVVALPVLILGIIGVLISANTLSDQIKEFDRVYLHQIETLIEQQLERPINGVMVISKLIDRAKKNNLTHIQSGISAIQQQHSHFAVIQVADLDGKVIAIAPYDEDLLGIDVSGHDYFNSSIDSNKLLWGASFIPEGSETPHSTLSMRYKKYIITAFLSLNNIGVFKYLSGEIHSEIQPKNVKIFTLTDQKGTFIYHSNEKMVKTQAYDSRYFSNLQNDNGDMQVENVVLDGIEYRASIVFLPKMKWKVALYTPLSEFQAPVMRLIVMIVVIIISVIIMAIVFSYFISNKINDALNKLIIISDAIGKDEYEIPPEDKNPSQTKYIEFNQLANSFRLMATKVKERQTEIKRVHSYLSKIVNSMPSILIGVDTDLNVTLWNSAAEAAVDINAPDVYGRQLIDVFPLLKHEISIIEESKNNKQVKYVSKRNIFESETPSFHDITVFPLIADDLLGVVIRIDDVTDKVQLEEMMVQNEKMLSIGGLAAGMAHEINNPLAGMMQTANVINNRLIEKLDLPANQKAAEEAGVTTEAIAQYMRAREIPRMIQTIKDSGKHAAEVVLNMLAFARKGDRSKSTINIGELIYKTLEIAATDYDMKKEYDFKQIKVEKEIDAGIPSLVCEQIKIQQVLLNLIRNSAQAMQETGTENPTIYVRSKASADGELINIEVEDNGPGMDEETMKRIFEPFYTTKGVGKGTGLGLSVSYFIITENHGGEIAVSSQKGVGTKFLISLPTKGNKDG